MLKGLINQLTTNVTSSPLGWRATRATAPHSTPTIIGSTIAQICTATTRATLATSVAAMALTSQGAPCPISTPTIIASPARTLR
ncbi:hypothetical protein [Tritonibacter horizontis]|uniref:Uncharacterized protein n=1 Tax=Tritonibacter horizontis TaxID=1768241 RepID=A0A132BR37_9RHOB|nr:hypothetical protein TRIHO_42190 [Tritonibacter horizontis]